MPSNARDALVALAALLAPGRPNVADRVMAAYDDPAAYLRAHADRLAERGIGEPVPGLAWIALVDALADDGLLAEIDWKEDGDEVVGQLRELRSAPRPADAWAWAGDGECDLSTEDFLGRLGDRLWITGTTLATLDIDSDCYPLVLLPSPPPGRANWSTWPGQPATGCSHTQVQGELARAGDPGLGMAVAAMPGQAQTAVHPVTRWRVHLPPGPARREVARVAVRCRDLAAALVGQERGAVHGAIAADAQVVLPELARSPFLARHTGRRRVRIGHGLPEQRDGHSPSMPTTPDNVAHPRFDHPLWT